MKKRKEERKSNTIKKNKGKKKVCKIKSGIIEKRQRNNLKNIKKNKKRIEKIECIMIGQEVKTTLAPTKNNIGTKTMREPKTFNKNIK